MYLMNLAAGVLLVLASMLATPRATAQDVKAAVAQLGIHADIQAGQTALSHLEGEVNVLESMVQNQFAAYEAQKATLIEWLKQAQGEAKGK